MNGPLKMYQLKPIIRPDLPIELPNCMYKMKNLLSGHNNHLSEHVSSAERNLDISEQKLQVHPEMAALQERQQKILEQLSELKNQMLALKGTLNITNKNTSQIISCTKNQSTSQAINSTEINKLSDIVINVNPENPPFSLLILQRLWKDSLQLVIRSYLHSTVVNLPKTTQDFVAQVENFEVNSAVPQLLIRLIWKNVDGNVELLTSSSLNTPIFGEVNVLRYLTRIGPANWNYETSENPIEIDSVLDICYLLSRSRTKTERHSLLQSLNGKLGKSQWLCNRKLMSLADVAASSAIKQVVSVSDVNANLMKFLQRCGA